MPDAPRSADTGPHLRVTQTPKDAAPTTAGPQVDIVSAVAREVLAGIKAADPEPEQQPTAKKGGTQPPPRRHDMALAALAVAGALLWQRGEAIRDEMNDHAIGQAASAATQSARLDAFESAAALDRAQTHRHENTLRETLFILGEDSRAEWDALAMIHAATKAPGAPDLRQPATADRLQALREAMTVDRAP